MKQIKRAKVSDRDIYNQKDSPFSFEQAGKRILFGSMFLLVFILSFSAFAYAIDGSNERDTQGNVNENAAVSFGVPMGDYKGREMGLPIALNYSSSNLWRIQHTGKVINYGLYYTFVTQSLTTAIYAEHSTAGWKSTLDLPTIELPVELYDIYGQPGAKNNCSLQVPKLYIHMPDGSTHEMRKNDTPYSGSADWSGTFYAVDGSRLRYDGTGPDTGTIYLPDGTRYILGHPISSIIDRNGNTETYSETTKKWTDTLGRQISNPIPPDGPQVGDYPYSIGGINGSSINYTLKWRNLGDTLTPVNGATPSLKVAASHYIPFPDYPLTDSRYENFPQPQTTQDDQSLFHAVTITETTDGQPIDSPVPTLVVAKGQSHSQLFNPVVLSEIVLPNGTSYKFSYDIYGEIDKVTYPTNTYEQYEYLQPSNIVSYDDPYAQTGRSVKSKKLSVDGLGDDVQTWTYINAVQLESGGGVLKIIAPDNTRTDIHKSGYLDAGDNYRFGVADSTNGAVTERDFYSNSAADGTGGQLLRRELTQYDQTLTPITYNACSSTGTFTASRNPRPLRNTRIIFEGSGSALAQTQTFAYDTTYQMTTGVDQIQSAVYDYVVVDNNTAQTAAIGDIPLGTLVKYTDGVFLNDQTYRDRNILGMQSSLTVKNSSGTMLSQSVIVRDETASYPLVNAGTASQWQDPNNNYRANISTMRTWSAETSSWIETHAQFDNFGNLRKQWDSSGDPNRYIETQYSSQYNYAYPTKIIAQAPDPTGAHGTAQTSEITKNYDLTTGLVTSVVDVNGQTTTTEYDSFLRPKTITPPAGGAIAIIEYGVPDSSGHFSAAQRFVKTKKQIDETNWEEQTVFFDEIGRTIKTQKKDAQGDVFAEIQYDAFGRIKQASNPYRQGEAVLWSKPRYDERNRVVESYAPAIDGQTGASLGTVEFGISTVSGFVGTYVTGTDASGRRARSITNAFGQVVRVDEAIGSSSDLGTLASPNQPTVYTYNIQGEMIKVQQGQQNRYFMYDSLGRLIRVRQPEQIVNTNLNTTGNPENNQWTAGFTYDVTGNVITATDAKNLTITNSYDNAGRVKTRSYSDGTTPQVDYYYDGKGLSSEPQFARGNLTKVSNSVSETRYTSFDNFGRMLASQQITDGQTYNFGYKYNVSGGLTEETYPSGRVVKNTLATDGGLAAVSSKPATGQYKNYASNFNYTATGDVKSMMLGNGRWETAQFNSRLQLEQIGLGSSTTDTSTWKVNYEYGELNSDGTTVNAAKNTGSVAKQTVTLPTTSFVQTYKYDELNRLTEAKETTGGTQNWQQTFGYDRYGNRTSFYQNISGQQTTATPTIDANTNRFTTGQNYVYDFNGNLVQDAEGRTFTYDGNDKQVQVKDSNQTVIGTYFYDGEGARVKKVTNTETTVFVYDGGGDMVAEYSTAAPTSSTTSYITTDKLGSPRVITDQTGAVIARRDFMPFGEEIYANVGARSTALKYSVSGTDNVRQRYTGYEKDDETQLDFAEARMYQNKHGRFQTVDPLMASASLSNPQTFNRYTYTGNNPINYNDPSGLMWVTNDNHDIGWIDGNVVPEGWRDITGQVIKVTQVGTDFANAGASVGSNVLLNADHTVTLLGTDAELAQTAAETGTNVVATQEGILENNTPSLGDHITSAFMTLAENNGGSIIYDLGVKPYNQHTETGQFIGNALTFIQVGGEITGGIGTAGGGGLLTLITSPLCATGIGCAVPATTATITAGGLIAIAHGTAVFGNTLYNINHNQGDSSRSSSRTEPTLPDSKIAEESGVTIEHNYKSNDHGFAHAHVVEDGKTATRIGPNGKPYRTDPQLTPKQGRVVSNNRQQIRKALNKVGRWLKYNEGK